MYRNGIFDSKPVMNLKTFESDKSTFRNWNDKLVNAMNQAVQHSRKALEWMMKMTNSGHEADIKTQWPNKWAAEWNKSPAIEYTKFAESMHYVLMDKCEGEALTRVRSVMNNDGIMEYVEVFKWFTETTGLAMSERMKTIMTPNPPKKEE